MPLLPALLCSLLCSAPCSLLCSLLCSAPCSALLPAPCPDLAQLPANLEIFSGTYSPRFADPPKFFPDCLRPGEAILAPPESAGPPPPALRMAAGEPLPSSQTPVRFGPGGGPVWAGKSHLAFRGRLGRPGGVKTARAPTSSPQIGVPIEICHRARARARVCIYRGYPICRAPGNFFFARKNLPRKNPRKKSCHEKTCTKKPATKKP